VNGNGGLVWQAYAMGIWILGMALFAGLLLARMHKLRRWHREQVERRTVPPWFHELMVATARRIGLDRLPAIVFSEEAVTPAVYGAFRPVLLLPANYTEDLSREEAEHVLLHELAHLKRGDLWLHALGLLLQIVYWFNPLLIWARRQTRHVRELCCDLTIARHLKEKTVRYRKTLLNTARELLTESLEPGMGLLGVFEEPFRLVARLRWLETESWRRRKWGIAASCLVFLIMVPLVLPMAAVDPEAASDAAARSVTDLSLREETRWERYFLVFRTDSEVRSVSELWLGDGRAALLDDDHHLILDRHRNTFTWINPRDRTFVEARLPLDTAGLLSDELKRERGEGTFRTRVEPNGETRDVHGYPCDGYVVTQWEDREGTRHHHFTATVWATKEVEGDVTLAEQLLDHRRRLQPRDRRSIEELNKIRGVQVLLEFEGPGRFLVSERMIAEDVEIALKKPPRNVYEVPADYARKEQLTPADF
jgi:beta-lactamase regulating signal transducer with metallopeptidase domain